VAAAGIAAVGTLGGDVTIIGGPWQALYGLVASQPGSRPRRLPFRHAAASSSGGPAASATRDTPGEGALALRRRAAGAPRVDPASLA